MIKLEVKDNFLFVTDSVLNTIKRFPRKDSSYEIEFGDERLRLISPPGIRQYISDYLISDLVDLNDIPFASLVALEDFLNEVLALSVDPADLLNLPTDDQKAAMDNAVAPSASNPFVTSSQIVGGLPTGEIPTGRAAKTTANEVTSATFVDVPGLSTTVTVASSVPMYAICTFEMTVSGGGQDPIGEVRLIVNGETSRVVVVDFGGGKANEVGSINFRTAVPVPIGSNIVKIQARKVSGAKLLFFDNGHLFAQGQQAPKGDPGFGVPNSGTTNQALTKTSNFDYDTQWTTIDKSFVGLGNVDNTSDADKPISNATLTALNVKVGNAVGNPNNITGLWRGTLSQYNAIPTKDNSVIYFIE